MCVQISTFSTYLTFAYIIILKLLNSVSVIITNRETVRMNVKFLQSEGFHEEGGLCSHGLFCLKI